MFRHGQSVRQVKQQKFGRFGVAYVDITFASDLDRVTGYKTLTVNSHLSADQVHIGGATRREWVHDRCITLKDGRIEPSILMNGHGAFTAIVRGDQSQLPLFGRDIKVFFFVAGFDAFGRGLYPYLQEMNLLVGRIVEFTMHDTRSRTHALHITIPQDGPVTHVVFVRELALEDIGNDFHVPVAMGAKAFAGLNPVFVNDQQGAETGVKGIVVMPERECVMGMEPSEIGKTAVFTFT